MKVRKNYKDKARFIYFVLMVVWFSILYVNSFSSLIWFLIILNISGVIFYCSFHALAQSGVAINRYDIKEGVKFRLEKISGPGNEKYYFIYEGNEKLFYTDISEFENGFYVRDGDELLKEEEYTQRAPV